MTDILTRTSARQIINLARDIERDSSHDDERSLRAGFLDLPRRDLEKYSLLRAITGKRDSIMRGACQLGSFGSDTRWTGIEAEADRAIAAKLGPLMHGGQFYVPAEYFYRDLNVAVGTAGGFLVGTANGSFIDTLRNRSTVFRLGATRAPGQRENLTLPKQTGSATITWLSTETTQATESTPAFVQVSGTPKTCSAYFEISDKLLKQSNPAAEGIVLRGLAADLAVGVDAVAINGSGVSGQPLGILGTTGIGTVTGTTLAYAGLVEAQVDIADNNAVVDPNALGYLTTPAVAQTLKSRQRFTSTDSPLWAGAIHEGSIEGVRALSTKNMLASTAIFGDWSALIVAEWGVLVVEINPFADFKAGIVGIRALWSVDILIQQPLSFTAITSIT
jgi:HK97 family phage major capsid protein